MQAETRMLWDQAGQVQGVERAEVLTTLGGHLLEEGELRAALEVVAAARDIFAGLDDWRQMAMCDHNSAVILATDDRPDEAAEAHRQAADLYRRSGEEAAAANCVCEYAVLLSEAGRRLEAAELLAAGAQVFEAERQPALAAAAWTSSGEILIDMDDAGAAITHLERGRQLFRGEADAMEVARCDLRLAQALGRLGRKDDALAAVDRARWVLAAGDQDNEAEGCSLVQAEILIASGQLDEADDLVTEYQTYAQYTEEIPAVARSLVLRAQIALARGERAESLLMTRQAVAIFDAAGDDVGMALALAQQATTLRAMRRTAQARKALAAATQRLDEGKAGEWARHQVAAAQAA